MLQGKADKLLAETKTRLKNLENSERLPLSATSLLAHLEALHAPGLWRLLNCLERSGHSSPALDLLQRWADHSTKLLQEARGLERRYLGHRDWFYHNIALQLCRRYQRLLIVNSSSSQDAGEKGGLPFSFDREPGTYRHLAAPARFVSFLQQTAKKTNTEIHTEKSRISPCSRVS
jgi:hypothetical protein